MLGMMNIKGVVYGAILGVLAIYIGYGAYKWHFHPIAELRRDNASLQGQLDETGRQLNICESQKSKVELDGFIDGVSNRREETIIDFSNIEY